MKKRLFKPIDGRPEIEVSSKEEIRQYVGNIMNYFGPIEIINDDLVVTYLDGSPFTLGHLI